MKKIVRNISLENLKSRFPGLLPYYKVKDQLVSIYAHEGSTVNMLYDKDKGFDVLEEDNRFNGNWGEMVCDFSFDGMYRGKEINPTFVDDQGNKIYNYGELNRRYNILRRMNESKVCLEQFRKNGVSTWKIGRNIMYSEREEMQDNMQIFPASDFGKEYAKEVREEIETYGYMVSKNKETEQFDEIIVIDDIQQFNNLGGFYFIDFFEELLGIFEVDDLVEGIKVPKYMYYWFIPELYNWMYDHALIKEGKTREKWEELGGADMMRLITSDKIRPDGIRPVNFLLESLKKISSDFKFIIPELDIAIPITSNISEIGALTIDEETDFTEKDKEEHPELYERKFIARGKDESMLSEVKSRFLSYDDSGKELPGLFERKEKVVDGNVLPYLLTLDKSTLEWKGEYVEDKVLQKTIYKTIPVVESVKSPESVVYTAFLVEYDNGKIYEEIKPPHTFYLIDGDTKQIIEDGKVLNTVKWENNYLPETTDPSIIYIAEKMVYENQEIIFKKRELFQFNEATGSWIIYKEPDTEFYRLSENDTINVKEEGKTVMYGVTGSPEFAEKGGRYYQAKIKSCNIPFFERRAFNIVKLNENEVFCDFIDKMEETEDSVYFEYIIGAKCKLIKDTEYVEHYIKPYGNGIKYTEKYRLIRNKPIKAIFLGKEIECFFDVLDMDINTITVRSENLKAERNAIQADVEYLGNSVWSLGGAVANPAFKQEYLNGITFENTPEINIVFDRGNASAFEGRFKLMECNTLQDLKNYGNNYFNLA